MAITKTTSISNIVVVPKDASAASSTNAGNPMITVWLIIEVDDDSDNELPMSRKTAKYIYRYVEDGGSATDVSAEDALVQSIAAAIWS